MSELPARAHVVRREQDGLFRILARGLLLLAWSSVLWGTLLFLSLLTGVLSDGPAAVLARLDPRERPGLFPWINAACTVLAPFVWLLLAGLIVPRKRV